MNILLLGSGGREHALAWKLRKSNLCGDLLIAPGNAGTGEFGRNINLSINNFDAIAQCCIDNTIDMVVVGPEEPLVNGVYDFLKTHPQLEKLIIVGPSAKAAQLEGSKAFSKHFMERHGIPTAGHKKFDKDTFEAGKQYINKHTLPVVLKADGLAAGKGVVIATTHEQALQTLESMIINEQFGAASSSVVVEEFLQGIELSLFVLTDGKDYKIIGHAKDYKRIGEGDTGLNTGGMGCVSPVPFADAAFLKKVEEKVVVPTIKGLYKEGLVYHGFVFIGLMNNNGEPQVIEYNCRMGDPETEVVLPRLKNDLIELFIAMHNGTLNEVEIEFEDKAVATIMAVSGGYPGEYKKGLVIEGLDKQMPDDVIIFQAGTTLKNNTVVTNGGRVLAVSAYGEDLQDAVEKSKKALKQITFEGMYFRNDIGFEFK